MRIAIVGTGIAGLTAGYLLHQSGHQVTLIERMVSAGLSGHGMTFTLAGESYQADVPVRLFNSSLWPNLFQLYHELGVNISPVDPSKSFGKWNESTKLILRDSFFPPMFSWDAWAQLRFASNRQIARDLRRMQACVPDDLKNGTIAQLDFQSYLNEQNFSQTFREQFLFPALAATVCTCSYASLKHYPADVILRAMQSLVDKNQLFRVGGGAAEVSQRLTAGISDIRYSTSVHAANQQPDSVRIELASGEILTVDHLIVATQANSAIKILPALNERERTMLNSFEYENIEVVLHRDPSFMPPKKKHWSQFNFRTDDENTSAMCTMWMNRFYNEWRTDDPVFQTITPFVPVPSDSILCQRRLQRPVVNRNSLAGLARLQELHSEPNRRIWFCGSYASSGIPLLESGVVSSQRVVAALT